ncbi:TauD/TfdA family dioxygenase [Frankia sp. Cas3]|uniref:TauD/TfdA dioxygenase family protein n=1 Tax=Frankia sp. Cas3 TaxID=3073926 RepID=UPI002AD4A4EC|nr:TauD/TfdA family dioxygenase [Frankia sp. Cas3]
MSIGVDVCTDGTVGRLSWELLAPFGVRLHVDDLRAGLAQDEQDVLATLLYQHGFVVAADQQLTKADLRRVGSYVAPLLPEEHEANPVLALNREEGGFGTRELVFHRDLMYAEHPFHAIALHALSVAEGETSTFVSSGTLAYRRLPAELKDRLAGLSALNSLHGRDEEGRISEREVYLPGWPGYVHPLAARHPITDEPVLLACLMSTVRVEGLAADSSEELLQQLFGHLNDPANVYEHTWRENDLLIWDNFGCAHARRNLAGVSKRTLQRLTMGKLSFPLAYPNFSMRSFTDSYDGENYMGKGGGQF